MLDSGRFPCVAWGQSHVAGSRKSWLTIQCACALRAENTHSLTHTHTHTHPISEVAPAHRTNEAVLQGVSFTEGASFKVEKAHVAARREGLENRRNEVQLRPPLCRPLKHSRNQRKHCSRTFGEGVWKKVREPFLEILWRRPYKGDSRSKFWTPSPRVREPHFL